MKQEFRISLAGMALLAVALGIGRFTLTPLLPLMQADAGLGLIAGGWLASINLLGYLVGALMLVFWPVAARPAVKWGLAAIVACTLGMGLTVSVAAWLLLRFVAGIASAALMVTGIAWTMTQLRARSRGDLEAVMFAGVGAGVAVTGVAVAATVPLGVSSSEFWIGFGVVGAALAAYVWHTLRVTPVVSTRSEPNLSPAPSGPAWPMIALYGLNGIAYIIPATFLPLIAGEHLQIPGLREWFWPLFGGAAAVGVLLVPLLPGRLGNRTPLAGCFALMAGGILLCVGWPSIAGFALGSVLIGGVAMPVVMLVMREARLLAPENPTRLIAALTTSFGIGQTLGPIAGAWLADRTGGFAMPLMGAAICAFLALAFAMVRYPKVTRSSYAATGSLQTHPRQAMRLDPCCSSHDRPR